MIRRIIHIDQDKCNGCGRLPGRMPVAVLRSIKSTERAIVVRPIEA